MDIRVSLPGQIKKAGIEITGSKSETNRLLLLQALYPSVSINGASESDDSDAMRMALASTDKIIDIHHAGTAMRFLAAYFAIQEGREVVLTGSARMKERPIGILVSALQALGADIAYLDKEGFPPVRIKGSKLIGGSVSIAADTSSQYITALMLIAPKLANGLTITLQGDITSRTYIEMTCSLLREAGIACFFAGKVITIAPVAEIRPATITVESDWSSASYFYSIIAMASIGTELSLQSYKPDSRQGDSALVSIYEKFGVVTQFNPNNSITLKKVSEVENALHLDLNNSPDIAQTIAVTCLGLHKGCVLTGLHTLKIKETDRLEALKCELQKFGASVSITADSLSLEAPHIIKNDVTVETYNDHRMAMAFAPLALCAVSIIIKDAGVVSKSYPSFWNDMQRLGMVVEKL